MTSIPIDDLEHIARRHQHCDITECTHKRWAIRVLAYSETLATRRIPPPP